MVVIIKNLSGHFCAAGSKETDKILDKIQTTFVGGVVKKTFVI